MRNFIGALKLGDLDVIIARFQACIISLKAFRTQQHRFLSLLLSVSFFGGKPLIS